MYIFAYFYRRRFCFLSQSREIEVSQMWTELFMRKVSKTISIDRIVNSHWTVFLIPVYCFCRTSETSCSLLVRLLYLPPRLSPPTVWWQGNWSSTRITVRVSSTVKFLFPTQPRVLNLKQINNIARYNKISKYVHSEWLKLSFSWEGNSFQSIDRRNS